MKIYSEYAPNISGKGKFLSRLFPELRKLGAEILSTPDGADVKLALTRIRTTHKQDLPTVLRMDGIHLVDNKKNRWNNKRVKKSIKKADYVVYQSRFAKRMIEGILKVKPKGDCVIYNGAKKPDYPVSTGLPIDVIMVARWANRRHKRLKEMLNIAEALPNLKWAWDSAVFTTPCSCGPRKMILSDPYFLASFLSHSPKTINFTPEEGRYFAKSRTICLRRFCGIHFLVDITAVPSMRLFWEEPKISSPLNITASLGFFPR
jgi:hypothetical protein